MESVHFSISVKEMDCPVEAGMIKKKLAEMDAISAVECNTVQRRVEVSATGDCSAQVLEAIASLGFTPVMARPTRALPVRRTAIRVPEMDCPVEAGMIRKALEPIEGIGSVDLNTARRVAMLEIEPGAVQAALSAIQELGFTPQLLEATRTEQIHVREMDCPVEAGMIRKELEAIEGIASMDLNTALRTVTLEATASAAAAALEAIRGLSFTPEVRTPAAELVISVPQMDCPVEAGMIKKKLEAIEAVRSMDFNTVRRTVTVRASEDAAGSILEAIASLGFTPELAAGAAAELTVSVKEMDCPVEAGMIRKKLETLACVHTMDFSTVTRTVRLGVDEGSTQAVLEAIRSLGFTPRVADAEEDDAPQALDIPWKKLAGALAIAAAAEAGELAGLPGWLTLAASVAAIALAGTRTIVQGLKSLARADFNIKALMAVAVVGAIALGAWCEAAMVLVLYEIGETIEQMSVAKARSAVRELLSLAPDSATVEDAQHVQTVVPTASVAIGSLVRIASGEHIPLDGVVVEGETSVDQSALTGESVPVAKKPGDEVWAGTVNTTGSVLIRTTAKASASFASRIIRAVEDAKGERAPIERTIDRFAQIYTPAVFVVALATALLPPLAFGGAWATWIYRGLTLLVIACPCALVISTPVTIVCALATAARSGLIVKGGAHLEAGRLLKTVAFDKTGTLTRGRPAVADTVVLGPGKGDRFLAVAASLASLSRHPVSRAIAEHARDRGVALLPVEDFKELPGHGVSGKVAGSAFFLTDRRWAESRKSPFARPLSALEKLETEGKTSVVLSDALGGCCGWTFVDAAKPEAAQAVAGLRELGIDSVMLSGDNPATARAVAEKIGIADVRAGLAPEDKVAAVGELASKGACAMVGDGINDAPALARATVGFAMGTAGSGTAIETAAVAIMDDDPRKICRFVRIARAAGAILMENIAFAVAVKIGFALLDWCGLATMWMAVFADTGTCLIVVANGLRMLRK